jgi:hypothetical protein
VRIPESGFEVGRRRIYAITAAAPAAPKEIVVAFILAMS